MAALKTWRVRQLMALLALLALADCNLWAQNTSGGANPFATIHTFTGNAGGGSPNGITADANGVLYGTTQAGGNCSTCGIIYRLKAPATGGGRWTFTVLHKFVLSQDGSAPIGPLTIFNGKLYGTTSTGGDAVCNCGVVFTIGEDGTGYAVLHTFKQTALGSTPLSGLLIDTDGTIYGNTSAGGANGAGVIFKLATGGAYTVLHDMDGDVGSGPHGGMVFGIDGAIYGTQFTGGQFDQGAIFRITKAGSYGVLHDFKGTTQPGPSTDGAAPDGRLAVAANGTIYGTTSSGGGPSGLGTAWSIKQSGAKWSYTQLRMFSSNEATIPHSGLILAADDSLYGTGSTGGADQAGAVFQLLAPSNGHRAYRTLHSFKSGTRQGDTPNSAIVLVNAVIYGSTALGGNINSNACSSGCGTVFSDTP